MLPGATPEIEEENRHCCAILEPGAIAAFPAEFERRIRSRSWQAPREGFMIAIEPSRRAQSLVSAGNRRRSGRSCSAVSPLALTGHLHEAAPREGVGILMNRKATAPYDYRSAAEAIRKVRKLSGKRW